MTSLTPARTLTRITLGVACVMAVLCGLLGALAGGGTVVGSFFTRRRNMASFSAAQRSAEARGFADGLAHGLLIGMAQYEAAVFPLSACGVTTTERDSRRAFAYRVASEEKLPEAVRQSAATVLAALDEADRHRGKDAMEKFSRVVHDQLTAPPQ
ncbi:hypothetical protein ACIBBE_24065 [Streptomyces sp. NPDC051644]|uniref:hypothetical protein n=1 Tax=Streptomyces sp. NPDC051644 TaxID=3365666 RepID=UPI0037B98692